MDVRNTSGALDRLLLQLTQPQSPKNISGAVAAQIGTSKKPPPSGQDVVALSKNATDKDKQSNQNGFGSKQTRLSSEKIDHLENGFRRTQKFESANGRQFTRVEEFTTSNDRSKRIILQQNDSGSTTMLENVLDRQDDGTFRLTQRYTDENGDTKTNIQFNVTPPSRDIILGRVPDPTRPANDEPFQPSRGTQFDVSA